MHVYGDMLEVPSTSNHDEIKDAKESIEILKTLQTSANSETESSIRDKRFIMGRKFQFTSINYDEDTWSERLFYCLLKRYPDIQAEFTARIRGITKILQHMEGKLPPGTNLDSLIFWGSPDIIIKQMPIISTFTAEDGGSDSDSGDSLVFEHAFQQSDFKSSACT